jgi:hypothetical protein
MSFSTQRDRIAMQLGVGQVASAYDYFHKYLTTEHRGYFNSLNGRYVEQLFTDLVEFEVTKDIKAFLGARYKDAKEYAQDCYEQIGHPKDLYTHKIQHWTESARKCFDGFLIALIEDKLGEAVQVRGHHGMGEDRYEYEHLRKKGGNYEIIGDAFTVIYKKRSSMTHVKKTDAATGKRIVRSKSKKELLKIKNEVLDQFKKGLTALEKEM